MRRGRARRSDCGGEKDIKAGDGLSEVSARGENNQSGICLRRKGDGKNNYTTDGCGTVAPRSQRTRRKEVQRGVGGGAMEKWEREEEDIDRFKMHEVSGAHVAHSNGASRSVTSSRAAFKSAYRPLRFAESRASDPDARSVSQTFT